MLPISDVDYVKPMLLPHGGWPMAAGHVLRLGSFEPGDKTGLRLSPHLAPSTTIDNQRPHTVATVVQRHNGMPLRILLMCKMGTRAVFPSCRAVFKMGSRAGVYRERHAFGRDEPSGF